MLILRGSSFSKFRPRWRKYVKLNKRAKPVRMEDLMDEESCFLLIVASFLYTIWFTGKTNFTLLNLKTVYRNIKVFCGN